jgi:uncharacterized repeat protein (TIGR02543 family)
MKKVVFFLMWVLLLTSLSSCGFSSDQRKEPAEIIIDAGGGSHISIDENTTFETVLKSKPSKDGYVFVGWFSDSGYSDYIDPQNITNKQYSAGYAYAKYIQETSSTSELRQYTATITDSGRKNQQMDVVPLGANRDFTVLDLKRAGISHVKVTVTLDLCEVDDGYQYVFLYKDTSLPKETDSLMDFYDKYVFGETTDEDPSLLYVFKYEHGPGEQNTAWNTVTFDVTLAVSNLKDDLYIRYGASGKNDDTWKNENIVVTVTPIY